MQFIGNFFVCEVKSNVHSLTHGQLRNPQHMSGNSNSTKIANEVDLGTHAADRLVEINEFAVHPLLNDE